MESRMTTGHPAACSALWHLFAARFAARHGVMGRGAQLSNIQKIGGKMQENNISLENQIGRDGDAIDARPSFGLLETLNHWIILAMG